MDSLRFEVPGTPVPKARARSTKTGIHFTPAKTRKYEQAVAHAAKCAMEGNQPWGGPIELFIGFGFPVPDSWPQWKKDAAIKGLIVPTGKPDVDNCIKSVKDALNGIIWLDDSQVVSVSAVKKYVVNAHAVIKVGTMSELPSSITKKGDLAA